MKKYFTLLGTVLSIFLAITSCNKNSSTSELSQNNIADTLTTKQKLSMQIFGNTEFKLNKNDSNYLNALKRLSLSFSLSAKGSIASNNRFASCNLNGGDSTYGWYSDSDSVIVEGSFTTAKTSSFELAARNCTDLQLSAEEANQYLINEGYSDIAYTYYTWEEKRYRVIYAANALIELKTEFIQDYNRSLGDNQQEKLVNCILQAIGYSAIAEIGANWATKSRQHIIKAVGKLAVKNLNWFGAAIAVASFIDCMWG